MHGIGIGFIHYLFILAFALPYEVDVYLIEWPYVAMQMSLMAPYPEDCVPAIARCLRYHGHTDLNVDLIEGTVDTRGATDSTHTDRSTTHGGHTDQRDGSRGGGSG